MANSAKIQSYWLGAPLIDLDRRAFEATLLQRFSPNMEHALAHVDKVSEQQAAKGNALLVFNALLFGMFMISSTAATMQPRLFALGGLLALFSALLLLGGMYTRWGSTRDYASADREFRLSCESCYRRAYVLTFALCATALATFIAALPLLARFAPGV